MARGLAPGHVPSGRPWDNRAVIVDCAVYEAGQRREGNLALEDAYEAARARDAFVWIGLFEPTAEEFESVRREFDLHELAVEDAIRAHQRPKLEVYGDSLFVVLKTVRWIDEPGFVEFGEVLVFVGDDFLITVRHGETELHDVRVALEGRPDLMRGGPGAALHAIVDRVVDDYEPVIEQLDASIRETEADVFSPSRSNPAARIYGLKRAVLSLHGAIFPLLDPLAGLAGGRHEMVHEDLRSYFRDVYDHLTRMATQIGSFRELLTNVLTANLTQASVRQNEDVRKISAWAAIIAVPTLISGVYGMNFEHMPELTWTIGYPAALLLMALACVGLYSYFHRVGWL
jgi:magnesium transporter